MEEAAGIQGFGYIPKINGPSDIPEEFLSFAGEIYDSYGELDGDELEGLNHSEMPWIKAKGNLKSWQESNQEISVNDMKEYYRWRFYYE